MNILRLSTLALIMVILVPINASAHCKGKHTGNHEHCTGGDGGDDGSGEYFGSEGVDFRNPSGVSGFDWYIIGTPGSDNITAGSGTDLIEGGDGHDEITALGGNDEIHGQAGHDTIDGGEGTDLLLGGAGDDTLIYSLGGDTYDGGAGYDQLKFQTAVTVTVDIATATYVVSTTDGSGAQVTEIGTWQNIESIGGGPGNDFITGDALARNHISGGDGNDFILSGAGDDKLGGGSGDDEIYAGAGNDIISAGEGNDIVHAGAGNDIVGGLSYSGTSNDIFYGGEGCDTFIFNRAFGTATIMDFNYPYNGEFSCDLIHFRYETFWRADPGDAEINIVDNDIVIDIWIKRGGGVGGTVILKDALLNGVSVVMSDISFEPE